MLIQKDKRGYDDEGKQPTAQPYSAWGGEWGGGGGGQKLPALTLKVNNYFLILKQTPPNLATFPKIYLATIWCEYFDPSNLTFPWQPYFDRHVFRNFDFRLHFLSEFHRFLCNFQVFVSF